MTKQELQLLEALHTLMIIATPIRPDGTYNQDRKACQQLAEETIKRLEEIHNDKSK